MLRGGVAVECKACAGWGRGVAGGGSESGRFVLVVAMCRVSGPAGSSEREKELFGVSLIVGVEWEEGSEALGWRDRFVWGTGAVVAEVSDPGVVVEGGKCRLHKAVQRGVCSSGGGGVRWWFE